MKFCQNCGQMLVDDAEFCTSCGASCKGQNNNVQNNTVNTYSNTNTYSNQNAYSNVNNQINNNNGYVANPTFNNANYNQVSNVNKPSGLTTATTVFLILSIVWHSFSLLYNFIIIPMFPIMGIVSVVTGIVSLCLSCWFFKKHNNSVKYGTKLSTAFKVCNLLFNDLIAGILLLCDKSR